MASQPRIPWKHKRPRWQHTDQWEAVCPRCDYPFDQDEFKCPWDHADLVVRKGAIPKWRLELKNFFLMAFRFSRMVGQQELRCSTNDGFVTTAVPCPSCGGRVGGDHLRGIYMAPRLIFYVPFVLVLSLGVVRATGGVAFLVWPFVSSFFGWIYRRLFWLRPFRYLSHKCVAYTFYETNAAPQLLEAVTEPSR